MNEEELDFSDVVSVDDQIEGVDLNTGSEGIIKAINRHLEEERFPGDELITLTMPESVLKRHKEKINSAIWYVYDKANGSGIKMLDILIALESMLDATKMAIILDNAVKLVVAQERGIVISEDELELIAEAAARAGKKGKKKAAETVEEDIDGDENLDEPVDDTDAPSEDAPEELDITTDLNDEEAAIAAAVLAGGFGNE